MAKKRKSKSTTPNADGTSASIDEEVGGQMQQNNSEREGNNNHDDGSDNDDSGNSSSSDDDSLVLEGVMIRNPDVSDSEDDDDDDEISTEEEDEEEEKGPTKKRAKKSSNVKTAAVSSKGKTNRNSNNDKQKSKQKKKKKQQSINEPEMIQVDFVFCDMNERFFHGMKTLLHRHSVHAPHSSQLADLIIENEMVGTILSTDDDPKNAATASSAQKKKKKPSSSKSNNATSSSLPPPQEEVNVFGLASIINLTANHSSPCIQSLKSLCLKHCPSQYRPEMETVLSGKTKRPAGFFFQERMVNVPLEITEVLHQQLVLDMDYAVENADDEDERKSLDFGAFVRLAPCYKQGDGRGGGTPNSVIYKYFDDEIFATNAEFVYTFEAPKMHDEDEERMWCSVIVITKTGHRGAMKELKKMIHGS